LIIVDCITSLPSLLAVETSNPDASAAGFITPSKTSSKKPLGRFDNRSENGIITKQRFPFEFSGAANDLTAGVEFWIT
jgi:hypothetical protein